MKKLWLFILIECLCITHGNLNAQNTSKIDSAFFDITLSDFTKGHNHRRYNYLKRYKEGHELQNISVKTESIDWFGLYKNVLFEKKGKTDSIVYIVCHYDKIDGNIFSVLNCYTNGFFDILLAPICFSKGAYDNGTGVISLLALLNWVNTNDLRYTYRFLFAGMEEYGLRGSRSHISRLKHNEWQKCVYAINIDMIASKGNHISVTTDISDTTFVRVAKSIANTNDKYIINDVGLPFGAYSDYYPFQGHSFVKDFSLSLQISVFGALIPQRSYFTNKKTGISVINFSDNNFEMIPALLSTVSPVSFGNIHSFRDNKKCIDFNELVYYHQFFKEFISYIEK